MRIIALSTLYRFALTHPDAQAAIRMWIDSVRTAKWEGPQDVKRRFSTASFLTNNRVVFNINGNKYRLVVGISYSTSIIFIKFFGTHAEYDKIDASTFEVHAHA